jgi:RNA polymerase sigma-70 factor (ECF subfamily)
LERTIGGAPPGPTAQADSDGESGWQGLAELRGALRAFLARHCDDENEMEDVIQETYLRAARFRSGRRGVQRLRPWTMRIALNVLSDLRRRSARTLSTPLEDAVFELPDPVADESAGAGRYRVGRRELERETVLLHLERAVALLREDDRLVLDAFYGGERCSRTTALACGIPRRLVKMRLFRARQRLLRVLRRRVAMDPAWIPSSPGRER